jgi:membrane-associated phospholipid phosphatase
MNKVRLVSAAGALVLVASGYFLLLFATQAAAPVGLGPIGQIDLWTAKLLLHIRNPALINFFTLVTAFGYWGVMFLLAGTASTTLWLYRRTRYVPGLWFGLIGNQTTVSLLKTLFDRPRPEFAIYREDSAAFPSGHSAASIVVFGFLTYVLIRERVGPRIVTGVTGLLLVILVGLSRLYLLEHYLSEVLSGYLVGAVWLVLAICVTEWRSPEFDHGGIRKAEPWRRYALVAVVVGTGMAVWLVAGSYQRGLTLTDPSLSGMSRASMP